MKITGFKTYKYWIEWCNWLFVKVTTDDGLYGWGEGSLHGPLQAVETAVHELGQILVGQDPGPIERHWQTMYAAWRWRGGPVLSTAMGAIDMALWDIAGKRLGVPVHRLLGGPVQERLRVYASHWLRDEAGGPLTTPDAVCRASQEARRRGFSAFKWSPFDARLLRENEHVALGRAAELMAAAREGAGPEAEIFIECSELLSPRTALAAARALAPYRPGWFEEPIPFENAQVMCDLQRQLPVPIACGERLLSRWQYCELIYSGGCRFIQPDVMHAAGITEVRKIAAMADTHYIAVAPHNPGGPICTLASMHLAAAIPNFYILEEMEAERPLRDALSTDPVRFADGYFDLPNKPGLGTDLRLEVLEDHRFRPQPYLERFPSVWY